MTKSFARSRKSGTSHRNSMVAAAAPANCANKNPGISTGRIPANVSLNPLAIVTAGLANEVEEVNQYAAVMYAPTANGTTFDRVREHPQITESNPNVAINSLNHCAGPVRACCEKETGVSPNMKW